MTAAYAIKQLADWFAANIAAACEFKKPTAQGPDDASYKYVLAHPKVFIMDYNRDAAAIENVPSILLSLTSVSVDLPNGLQKYDVDVVFCCWDSGIHGPDEFKPTSDPFVFTQGNQATYKTKNAVSFDTLNFIDFANEKLKRFDCPGLTMETKGWGWAIDEDPELRISDFRIVSAHFVFTEPTIRQPPQDADEKEIMAADAEQSRAIDAFL